MILFTLFTITLHLLLIDHTLLNRILIKCQILKTKKNLSSLPFQD